MNAPWILLADDYVKIRNLHRRLLEREGYSTLVAANGAEALELSRSHEGTIDVLLTEVEMPTLDGLTLFRQLLTERPVLKVIFMSSGLFNNLGLPPSIPFLWKPFREPELLSSLNKVLGTSPWEVRNLQVILVVDPNEERKARTNKILTENGYEVLLAASTEEAEVIVNSLEKIDLIVSEVLFAGGNSGIHLAAQSDASLRNIDTLLISHFHSDVLRNVEGFTDKREFLSNPFSPEEWKKCWSACTN